MESEQRTDVVQQLVRDLHIWRLDGGVSGRLWVSVRAAVSKLPSRSAVLPAELKVLELRSLVALLKKEKHEERASGRH